MTKSVDLTSGSVTKQLLRFTIPLILSGILQQLYTLCDSLVVGNLVSSQALGAVNSAAPVLNVFLVVVNGFVTGCTIVVSHLTGAGRHREIPGLARFSSAVLFAVSVCLGLVCLLSSDRILRLLHTPDEIFDLSRQYFQVIAYGIPFLAVYNLTSAIARGTGDSRRPFYVLLTTSLFNILGDLVFVAPFGIAGAAFATVLSQILSAILMSWLLIRHFSEPAYRSGQTPHRLRRLLAPESLPLFFECLRLGVPNIVRSALTSAGYLCITHVRNLLGAAVVEGISGAYNIDCFLMLPFVYAGNAFSVFTGTNLAAGRRERIRKGFRSIIACLVAYELPMLALLIFSARCLLGCFGLTDESIAIGYRFLCTASVFYPLCGIMQVLLGYFEGRKRVITSSAVVVTSLGVRILLSYLLLAPLQADIIAWAEIFSWIYALVVLIILYRKDVRSPAAKAA